MASVEALSIECASVYDAVALQAARQASLELQLQRVVVRGRGIVGDGDELKTRIRIEQLRDPKQIASARSHVGDGQTLAASDRLLQRDVPLIGPRKLQMRIRDQNVVNGRVGRDAGRSGVLRAQRERRQSEQLCSRNTESSW